MRWRILSGEKKTTNFDEKKAREKNKSDGGVALNCKFSTETNPKKKLRRTTALGAGDKSRLYISFSIKGKKEL